MPKTLRKEDLWPSMNFWVSNLWLPKAKMSALATGWKFPKHKVLTVLQLGPIPGELAVDLVAVNFTPQEERECYRDPGGLNCSKVPDPEVAQG